MSIDYSFYLIADYHLCTRNPLLDSVAEVIDHGVTCVQLRMKNEPYEKVFATAQQLQAFLRPKGIPFIINDFVDIARSIDADGVHLGQTDTPYPRARRQLGYTKKIGLSIENIQQAQQCGHFDCDYFGVGPIFSTTSKLDASEPIGVAGLKKIASLLNRPIVAIGGINEKNNSALFKNNIAGIAVASSVLNAAIPRQATQHLAQSIQYNQ